MVIKNLENKIKLVMIICSLFLVGCIIISISSIWTARVPLLGGMHHHQHFQYLDSSCDGNRRTAESVCVGW